MGRCPRILSIHLSSSVNVGCPLGRGHAFPIRLGLWKIGSPSELSQGPLTDLGVLLRGITQPTQAPPPQTPIWLTCTWPAWHGDAGPSTWVPSYPSSGADQQEAITSAYNNPSVCVCVCVCVAGGRVKVGLPDPRDQPLQMEKLRWADTGLCPGHALSCGWEALEGSRAHWALGSLVGGQPSHGTEPLALWKWVGFSVLQSLLVRGAG